MKKFDDYLKTFGYKLYINKTVWFEILIMKNCVYVILEKKYCPFNYKHDFIINYVDQQRSESSVTDQICLEYRSI